MPTGYLANVLPTNANLMSKDCMYHTFDSLTWTDFLQALTPKMSERCDLMIRQDRELKIFDGFWATRFTSQHWEVPLAACVIYFTMITVLKRYMASRPKIFLQRYVICWNFFLSFFSFAGMVYCVPKLLFGPAGVLSYGWYQSVCSHASSYGFGESGIFVFLFIYSKLAELLDTFFLLVRKSPVILLHW